MLVSNLFCRCVDGSEGNDEAAGVENQDQGQAGQGQEVREVPHPHPLGYR